MSLRDITLRLRALFRPRTVERELNDELAFHLERETQKLIDQGLAPDEARQRARASFGSVALAADECRDARGTAFVDSCVRDIGYAFRTFRRAPLPAFTIVATLGLGLGLTAVAFTIINPFLFRVDAVPNVGEIYEFRRPVGTGDGWVGITRPQFESIRRETRAFGDPFAMMEDIDSRIDGRMMSGTLVSGNFFQALGVRAAAGRTLLPGDDDIAAPKPVLVLSHRGWVRRFESDPGIVGRAVTVNGFAFEIAGVMPEGFRGLAIVAPDYWAPIALLGQIRPIHLGRENAVSLKVAGRLGPGVSRSAALAELSAWNASARGAVGEGRRDTRVALTPRDGTVAVSAEVLFVFTPIFVAFGLILVIGCANVANLLLARGVSRQREIGIRLAMGAKRSRVVRQLLTENLLLALAAAALGYVISRVLAVAAIGAVTSTLPPEFAEFVSLSVPVADWRVALFLFAGAVVSTIFFALSPALQATRIELVRTIRGEVSRDARPGRARNLLICMQVVASALLLTCSAVFLRSALASSKFDPGFRVDDTVLVELNNEPTRASMIRAVSEAPFVTKSAAVWPGTLDLPRIVSAAVAGEKIFVGYKAVSPEYFDVFGIEIVRGRGFTPAEQTQAAAVAVVSESTARRLRPDGNVLGEVLQLGADPNVEPPREGDPTLTVHAFTIVGVRRDVAGFRLAGKESEGGIYIPGNASQLRASMIVRVSGDVEDARRALLTRLTVIDPNMGQVMTIKTMAKIETYFLQVAFWLTVVLGALALALTLSGLFSVLSYLVEQRRKEIGVRMALGANARAIGLLVFSQTFRPVGAGLVIGCGLALALAIVLRSVSTEISTIVRVLDPVAYAASVFVIVTACAAAALVPARKAVRIDPIASLRQD